MGRVMVVGHRGAAGEAPENTIAAIEVALAAGADAVEIDLRLSHDYVAVVIHDATIDRTTRASGEVAALSAAELRSIAADGRGAIPSLDGVLEYVDDRCAIFCELKADLPGTEAGARLVRIVAEALHRHRAEAWTALHSFDPALVRMAREACPEVGAALITPGPGPEGADALFAAALRANAQAISVGYAAVTSELVRQARLRHLTVWSWTADGPDEWDRLINAGVDGIITNVPTALRAHLSSR